LIFENQEMQNPKTLIHVKPTNRGVFWDWMCTDPTPAVVGDEFHFQFHDIIINDRWDAALENYDADERYRSLYENDEGNRCHEYDKLLAILFGRDQFGRSVALQVEGFKPSVYIQFLTPESAECADEIIEHITTKILKTEETLDYEFTYMQDANGYTPTSDTDPTPKKFYVAQLYLNSIEQFLTLKFFENRRQKKLPAGITAESRFESTGAGTIYELMKEVDILETDVDLAHKFIDFLEIQNNQWLCIKNVQQCYQYMSNSQMEMSCKYEDISTSTVVSENEIAKFVVASFDTEWYTPHQQPKQFLYKDSNDNDVFAPRRRFVQEESIEDSLINFSTSVQVYGTNKITNLLHYVKSPFHDKEYQYVKNETDEPSVMDKCLGQTLVFKYDTEWDCIDGWAHHMSEQFNVDFMTLWNANFDLSYIKTAIEYLSDPCAYAFHYMRFLRTRIEFMRRNNEEFWHIEILLAAMEKRFRIYDLDDYMKDRAALLQTMCPKRKKKDKKKDGEEYVEKQSPAKVYGAMAAILEKRKLPDHLVSMESVHEQWKDEVMATNMLEEMDEETEKGFEDWFAEQRVVLIDRFEMAYKKALTLRNPLKSKFFAMGKLLGRPGVFIEKELNNSAKGENTLKYYDFDGLVTFDCMRQVSDRKKYSDNTLKTCAPLLIKGANKVELPVDRISDDYEKCDCSELFNYAYWDAFLPLKIAMDALKIILDVIITSQDTYVTIKRILVSGEQIKGWGLLTKFGHKQGIVMSRDLSGQHLLEDSDKRESKYQGATVLEADVGYHNDGPTITSDFGSLYPSIMINHNLCWTTQAFNEEILKTLGVTYETVKVSETETLFFVTQFPGMCPSVQRTMKKRRDDIRKEQKTYEEYSPDWWVCEIRQLKVKLIMNSLYGFFGVKFGYRPRQGVSAAVTRIGRGMLETTVQHSKDFAAVHNVTSLVVYGDTDSIMNKVTNYGTDALGIAKSICYGKKLAKYITSKFGGVIVLEHENAYYPYVLYAKKKYIGYKQIQANFEITLRDGTVVRGDVKGVDFGDYEMDDIVSAVYISQPYITKKGVEAVRRDKFTHLRNTHEKSIKLLLDFQKDELKEFVLNQINQIVLDKIPINEYAASGQLKDHYKTPPAHAVARDRKRDRNPGSEEKSGERIYFVHMFMGLEAKRSLTAYDLDYARQCAEAKAMVVDRIAYLTKMKKPVCQLIEPLFPTAYVWFDVAIKLVEQQLLNAISFDGTTVEFLSAVKEREARYLDVVVKKRKLEVVPLDPRYKANTYLKEPKNKKAKTEIKTHSLAQYITANNRFE
jgi:DNA polymerase elongation subunit (family B)